MTLYRYLGKMMYLPLVLFVFLIITVNVSLSISSDGGNPVVVTAWTLASVQKSRLLDSLFGQNLSATVDENDISISLNFNGIKESFIKAGDQRRGINGQATQSEAIAVDFIVPGVEGLLRCYLMQSKLFHDDLATAFPQLITRQGHCSDGRWVHLSFHTEHPDSFSAYFTVPGSLDFIYVDSFQKETNIYVLYFKGERKRRLSRTKTSTNEFQCGVKHNDEINHMDKGVESDNVSEQGRTEENVGGKSLRRRRLDGTCNNLYSMTLVSAETPIQYQHTNNQNLDRLTESMFCAIKETQLGSLTKTIKFTAGLSYRATYGFSTCPLSASFDSVMQIRSGSCDGPILACNDDASSSLRCSQISLTLDPGDVVFIQIAAFNSPSSMPTSWSLTVQSGTASPTSTPTVPPPYKSVVFRLAIVATAQYSTWAGNSEALILNKIGTTIARINGIYTRELGVFLQLIAKTNQLFCASNKNKCGTLPDYFAQQILNNVGTFITSRGVKDTEYDVAHVFSTGAGGLAAVGSLCIFGGKARGVSGLANPSGDSFSVDYVAHELGHQLGGEHSYRNCASGSSDPYVVEDSAVEPGSGSTVMAYAGICNYNIQTFSDSYFHPFSISQIRKVIDREVAKGCGQVTSSPSRDRVRIDEDGLPSVCRVPIGNFFQLKAGSARVAQNPSTIEWYQWDRVDPGPESYLVLENGSFRSWVPTKRNSRFFPNLYYLTFGLWSQDPYRGWERLPSVPSSWMMRYVIRSHFLQSATTPIYDGNAFGDVAMYDVPLIFINSTGPLKFTHETRRLLNQTIHADVEITFTWDPSLTTSLASTVEILLAENILEEGPSFDYDRDTKDLDWISLGKVPNNGQATLVVPWPGPVVYNQPKEVNWMIRSADSDTCSFFDFVPRGSLVLSPTAAPSQAPSPPTTWSPSTSPTTSQPSTTPTTSEPSTSPTTSNPTTSPTPMPTASPTTSIPSQSPITSRPTKSPSKSPTGSPTPPTLRPTQPPYIEYCLPNPLERNAKNCNAKKALCSVHGINLKWAGAGCGRKKKRKNDGGCQCAGYCGYKCKKACIRDKECAWRGKKKKAKCYSRQTTLVGQPIARCT